MSDERARLELEGLTTFVKEDGRVVLIPTNTATVLSSYDAERLADFIYRETPRSVYPKRRNQRLDPNAFLSAEEATWGPGMRENN